MFSLNAKRKRGEKTMKKLLATVVSLCMLAVLIPFTPVNAATVPWDADIPVNGTAQIGQTITVPQDTVQYYQLDLKAGQAVYFYQNPDTEIKANVSVYGNYSDQRDESLYDDNYYAVKDETVFVRLSNYDDDDYDDVTDSNAYVTIQAGQTFNTTVTKEDGRGNNAYFFKPSVTGEYTFRLNSSDDEADPYMSISAIKGGRGCDLKEKDCKRTYTFGSMETTVVLQAGTQYIIYVESYYTSSYAPYTLSLISAPAQPQTSVKVAKTKIKSVVSKKTKTAVVTWTKAKGATGYQVKYSTKKNFKNAKSVTVSAKKTKATLKKLTKGKKYYVKVRTLKKVNGKTYSSSYSKTLSVKVK